MTDDKTIQYLEAERDELVDQNFIGAEEAQLNRSPYYKLGQKRKGISIFHKDYKGIETESLDGYYQRMRLLNAKV